MVVDACAGSRTGTAAGPGSDPRPPLKCPGAQWHRRVEYGQQGCAAGQKERLCHGGTAGGCWSDHSKCCYLGVRQCLEVSLHCWWAVKRDLDCTLGPHEAWGPVAEIPADHAGGVQAWREPSSIRC
ncbi:hypothetical protein NDU88_004777 [Pleurodeles waltl]|uniref:Uncharacterized protein n=1 Tax=Pleurodeles waltl TaxID=8319 RepID=A0AAV7MCN2_PLEWA|nr:hypothetical protein NDU88_004777 [Pleurodeles waltl]